MEKIPPPKREPVEIPNRRKVPKWVCDIVGPRDNWSCVVCGAPDRLQWEHRKARAKGGTDTPDNIQLMCDREGCHKAKTKIDNKSTSKAKRLFQKDRGLKPKSKRPIKSPGFNKTKSKGFDGKVRDR